MHIIMHIRMFHIRFIYSMNAYLCLNGLYVSVYGCAYIHMQTCAYVHMHTYV